VGVARVGLDRDAVEGKRDAHGGAGRRHPRVDLRRALRSAELAFEVRPARDARLRQVGIELERMPANRRPARGIVGRQPGERLHEPPLADVAPRTHDVGDHVDLERFGHDLRFVNPMLIRNYARRAALAII